MVRRFMLLVWATLFALPFVIAQNAPVTKLKNVVVVPAPPTTISVDLEITGFTTQISAGSLKFLYNPTVLTYNGIFTQNPSLPGMMFVGNPNPGEIVVTYADFMLIGANLPPNAIFASLQFTYNGGISNLTWDFSAPTNNEWSDLALNPLNDSPESSYYLNGIVKDAISASSSTPITHAAQVISAPGPILFPITVDNLSYCDAISLTLDYNPVHLTYTGITNIHPALLGGTMSSVSGGKFYFTWTNAINPITSTLPNGTKLFDIQFTSGPGTSYLTWDDNPTTDCEYQDALTQTPYPDVPTPAFYKDGYVSDLSSTYTFSHVICKGANNGTITFNAAGGSLTYEYSIDNGANWSPSPAFTGLAPLTYDLLVRDASFPLVVLNLGAVTILEPAVALYVNTFESHRVRCKGEQNGQATINAFGGWGNYTYSINGITWHSLNIFDALFPGTYTLYAKDNLGCIASGLVQITEPTIALTATGVETKKVTCYGGSNGQITLTGYDGWGTYNYSKDDVTYQVSNVLTGFPAGSHTVYVKDKGGCVYPLVVTVTQPAAPLAISAANTKLVSCYGYSDGEITATATGGWGSYQYSIDNGITWQVSNLFAGLPAGPYTILVKDFEGCIVMSSVTMVIQPNQLEGVLSGSTTVCYGTNATVTVTIAGGTPPYTFTVTDGVMPVTVTNHPSTVYTFTQAYTQPTTWTWVSLTDANGCSSNLSGNAIISIFPLPVVSDATMSVSVDQSNWSNVGGTFAGGYTMCIDPVIPYHYLDINTFTVGPNGLLTGSFTQNAFYLNTGSVPGNFYSYWAAKGVVFGASGWQGVMWNIINGTAPMFYINYDGSDYTLVDGLQWQAFAVQSTLRITGDYPQGNYGFTGTVTDVNGCISVPFNISLQMNSSPVVTDVTLQESENLLSWIPVNGTFTGGYTMCLDAMSQYHYLDINTLTVGVNGLLTSSFAQNGFYLNTGTLPGNFYSYWAAKGVVSGATGWQGIMWNIINGTAPMFYINYDGVDYTLIDGLQYLAGSGANTLRISGDYPVGTYTFTGSVADVNGCQSSPFSINMTFNHKPIISFGFNGVEAGHNAAFQYCYDQPVGVTLYNIYDGVAPFSVTYTVNGGTPVTVTGLNTGDPLIAPQIYTPGTYNIVVTNITDANGCNAGAAFLALCQATVTINPEPAVGFSFNGQLAGTGSIFNYCYNDVVTVTLSDIWVGTAPFNITYEVNGVTSTVSGVNLNDQLFSSTLAPGTYVVQITSIVDAKGCSPASYAPYTATAIVSPEPIISFGFNGVEAGHNASFQYCYNETVAVTLFNQYSGAAPYSVTYTINGGLPVTVNNLSVGSVIVPAQLYTPGTYVVQVTNITDNNGCVASPAFLALCQATVIIHDEPIISFGFNGVEAGHNATFEYCYDQPVGVTLYAQYGGTAPYSVTYTVNGGTPVTVTGLNVGDAIIAPQTYIAGTYTIAVTNITDVYGCVASPAFLALCQAVVTINPEPAVGFSFNGTLAGTGTIFDFCYSDPVNVTLSHIWSGYAPFTVTYEVNGVPSTIAGVNLNGTLFSSLLAPGTYVVQITGIVDAKGCSPSSYVPYTATVNIHKINVSGYFKYHNLAETPLNNVTVNLKQGASIIYTMPTDPTGYYEFQGVCPGTYTVEAATIKPVVGAINSTDAIQVNIWGATPTPIEKVRYRAGDVDGTNFLDPGDALSILSYFVNNGTPAFNPSWVFWQANDITAINGTVLTPLPVLNVGFANIIQDFYGLVNGDFNRSFIPNNAKGNGQINLQQVSSLKLEQAGTIEVPVTAGMNMNVTAISLILNYPSDKVEIMDVTLGNQAVPVLWKAANGELRIGYANVAPVWFQNGETVLTIKVKATGLKTGEVVNFTLTPSSLNEIADATAEVIPGALLNIAAIEGTVGIQGNEGNDLLTISAWPNPFDISAKISYTLPAYGQVAIEVFDLTGRKVMTLVDQMQQAGVYTISLDAVTLPAGVYNTRLTLVTPEGMVNKSVRIIRNK